MSRSLNGLTNSGVRSLNGLNNLSSIKTKYDFNGNVLDGSLLIGNGSTGYFETNTLTAGTNITLTNTSGNISIASTDTDTVYTLQSPLSFISTNKIQLQQTLFNISTTIADNDYVPYFNSNGNFDRITFSNLKTLIPNTTYSGLSPIGLNGSNQFEMDFSGLTDYGAGTITDATEFLVSTDGVKTMKALTYTKLKTDLDSALFQYTTATAINNNDLVLFFDETNIVSNKNKNITFANFRNLLSISAIDFGTQTATTGNRTFGNTNYTSTIKGSSVIVSSPLSLNFATTLNANLEIYGNMSLNSTGNFATNNRNITWGAYSGTSITAYLAYFGANESLVLCSRGGSGNLLFCTGTEEATRLTINDDDIIATNNISVINTTATSGAILDLQFQNQGNDTYNYLQFGKNATGSGNSAKLKYYHDSTSSGFNYLSLGLTQGNFLEEQIKIFNSGNIEFLNTGTTLFQPISIQNPTAIDQWNILQNYRFAVSSSTTAYSIRIFDYQPTGTNYQYYGIFSNNNVGDQASPTCPFQIRNDGYIELKSNFTNNITSLSNLGLTGITTQLKYVGRSSYNSYHPMQQMGLASGGAWTRWNYSHTGGTDYGGIAYSSGSSGIDCITWDEGGNFWITGTYSPSDKRIKKDIVDADLDECITVMKSIKLKKYKYTDAYQETYKTTKENVYGFLADDVLENEYLNYAGSDDGLAKDLKNGTSLENFKTIDKSKILTVLWGCCNKQQEEIELLKSEIANIKNLLTKG